METREFMRGVVLRCLGCVWRVSRCQRAPAAQSRPLPQATSHPAGPDGSLYTVCLQTTGDVWQKRACAVSTTDDGERDGPGDHEGCAVDACRQDRWACVLAMCGYTVLVTRDDINVIQSAEAMPVSLVARVCQGRRLRYNDHDWEEYRGRRGRGLSFVETGSRTTRRCGAAGKR